MNNVKLTNTGGDDGINNFSSLPPGDDQPDDSNKIFADKFVPPTGEAQSIFEQDGVEAIYYKDAGVIILWIDEVECGWWNVNFWNQAQLGIIVADTYVRINHAGYGFVDFSRKVTMKPVEFPETIGGE